ncbi:Eukaryotic initiation factor 4A-III [Gryllus bimaculatus]|nr:Eukaryotic initiation factor 4A-III [Gryllus bimaculatus]
MDEDLEGFGTLVTKNKTTNSKKSKKKGGGFQSMGLSFPVLKGVQKRGYKVPTPIQRKTIPIVLDGRDIVAMARTGSGKTACFLLPMFEKLLNSVKKPGARSLILSPTRELALQTLKFIKEIGKFTDLKPAVVLGGDAMDSQFAALHGNPDIIVATPGRLLHVCVEMELKLQYVQYVVFDEADRLFEMGFGEQLQELLKRLPEARQTLLFSATLPKMLVEFARAGLNEPALIRLDVESKIPEKLELVFLCCRTDEKIAALLSLLKHVIPSNSQTVVFAATKHHVEYLKMVLDLADISNCCIYSTMDASARKINAAKFQVGKASVLIVTDIAARGLDIPQLDCVINFNFPAKPKLFVHRVGRCARAGRAGTAYSLVSSEEFPYLLDLHLFLGRPLQIGEESSTIGSIPSPVVEEEQIELLNWLTDSSDLKELQKTANNGYKSYLRTRPGASVESVRRAKELGLAHLKPHPIFNSGYFGTSDGMKAEMLSRIKSYRPTGTIFEIGKAPTSETLAIMREAKKKHSVAIATHKRKLEEQEQENPLDTEFKSFLPKKSANATENKLSSPTLSLHERKKRRKAAVDTEHFVPYQSADHHTEQGLMVNNFQSEAAQMQFDLTADSADQMKRQRNQVKWDRRKKKFVGTNQETKNGKILTESGVWIPASYKTDRYAQWKEKNRIDANNESSDDSDDGDPETQRRRAFMNKKFPNTHWGRHNEKLQRKMKSELKRPEQILKVRQKHEREEWRIKNKQTKKKKKSRR